MQMRLRWLRLHKTYHLLDRIKVPGAYSPRASINKWNESVKMDWGTKSNSRIYANKSARRSAFSTTSSVKPSYWKRFKSKDQSIYELTWDTTSLSFKCPKGSGCRSSLTQILAIYDIAFRNRFANIDTTKDRRERWMFVMYRGDPIWVCT